MVSHERHRNAVQRIVDALGELLAAADEESTARAESGQSGLGGVPMPLQAEVKRYRRRALDVYGITTTKGN